MSTPVNRQQQFLGASGSVTFSLALVAGNYTVSFPNGSGTLVLSNFANVFTGTNSFQGHPISFLNDVTTMEATFGPHATEDHFDLEVTKSGGGVFALRCYADLNNVRGVFDGVLELTGSVNVTNNNGDVWFDGTNLRFVSDPKIGLDTGGTRSILVNGADGFAKRFRFQNESVDRWAIGANAQNNFALVRYNTSGVSVSTPILVDEDTGQVDFAHALELEPQATEPAVPASNLLLYAASFGGRVLPKIMGPSGVDTALQAGLHGNSVVLISPSSGTAAPSIIGGTLTTAATISLQFTAGSTNRWSATSRKRFQTSTTAGNASGMRTAYGQWFRGSAAGYGGFFFRAQFGAQLNLAGGQKFIGLCASTGALAGEPSALVNMCGVGYDSGDSAAGNWFFMRNDGAGTATKVDLGSNAARGTTQGWDLIMFLAPNGSELFVRIVNLNTATVVLDTSYTTDLPATNTAMAFKCEVRNGAVAAADNIECAKVYIESDY